MQYHSLHNSPLSMTIRTHVSHMLAKAMQAGRIHQVRGCMVHVVDQAAIDTGHMYNVQLYIIESFTPVLIQ